jgi:diaminopimelate epimerase
MIDVAAVNVTPDYVFFFTGSPHHVQLVKDLENYDVKHKGASIRYGDLYTDK